jgi:DNA invertase Pin-like site-specific DNA recombinase
MIFGYSRSRKKEELREQREQLQEANCTRIFTDEFNGRIERKNFDSMVEQIREGDQLIVPSIHVFPLTLIELVEFFSRLNSDNVKFKALQEKLDDLTVFPYLNRYQRRSRSERAMANLGDARKANKNAGRPKGISDEGKKEALAVAQLYKMNYTIDQIMAELGMTSRSQVYKRLGDAKVKTKRRKKKSEK